MQQLIYQYLLSFSPSTLLPLFESLPSLPFSLSSLNLCQVSILSQSLLKSLLLSTPLTSSQLLLQSLYSHNLLSPTHSWGFLLSLFISKPTETQQYLNYYINKQSKQRIKYLIIRDVELFEEGLIDGVVGLVQDVLRQHQGVQTEIASPFELYTFQCKIMNYVNTHFTSQFTDKMYHLILNTLLTLFRTHPSSACHLFLSSFHLSFQFYPFLTYFLTWLSQQLPKEFSLQLMEVVELICKTVNLLEKEKKVVVHERRRVDEVGYLYHLWVRYVVKEGRYQEFEGWMYRYSDVSRLVTLITPQFINSHQQLLTQHLTELSTQSTSQQTSKLTPSLFHLLINPFLSWKLFLPYYLSLSSIKFKRQTLDPMIFLLLNKQLWFNQKYQEILSVCFWLSVKEWKERLPEVHEKKGDYLKCMGKVLREFVKGLPGKLGMLREWR